ncbi:2076_t:CDS:2, partial [Acaulospora colombiana]
LVQKHIKRQIISLEGGIQVIVDLNAYYDFVATLKVPHLVQEFANLKKLGHVFVVAEATDLAAIVRDATRYGGTFRPEDVYEFVQRRSDWKKIERDVDRTMYNLSFKEDCRPYSQGKRRANTLNSDKFVPLQPKSWSQYFHLAPQPDQPEPINLAQRFKATFSRENVSVHFVGVWDTVSSVGIVRGKNLPLTDTVDNVCFFRHALALDERRVKFLPEYAIYEKDRRPAISKGVNQDPSTPPPPPHIKEVCGGGNQLNLNLDLGRTPGIWMMSEAIGSGALLKPKKVEWDWQNLDVVQESLTGIWSLFEWIPFKRLSYQDSSSTTY